MSVSDAVDNEMSSELGSSLEHVAVSNSLVM